jgi:hypoxanthine phosphoribosyltransferase
VDMTDDVARILIDSQTIEKKVSEMGQRISADYKGKDPVLICILKGALIFTSDLLRQVSIPITLDFIAISSYGVGTSSSGVVRILKDLDSPIEGRHVLIIEDIVDSGLTLSYLCSNLKSRHPASLKTAVLLDKPARREIEFSPDYLGFSIPDKFVVGYGLDYAEKYRNLPFIGVLKPEVYTKP